MYHFSTDEEYEIIKKIVIYYSIDRHDGNFLHGCGEY